MKIFCHTPGDRSVGIWPGDITIEIHGMKEEDFDPELLEDVLKFTEELGEIVFGEKAGVATESQMKKEIEEEEKMFEQCEAMIWHGPGHQSRTRCQRKGKHTVHKAIYGRYDQTACWEGDETYSGYFDEPPEYPKGE